jgi:hypothetical protein
LVTDGNAPSKIQDDGQDDPEEQAQFPWVIENIFHFGARFSEGRINGNLLLMEDLRLCEECPLVLPSTEEVPGEGHQRDLPC